jgi:hypothetical protein
MIDGFPGYSETSIGAQAEVPLPDKCTIMLLKGSIQLDDENKDITETFVGLQTEGSKTLRVKGSTTVVWLPSVCCWDSSECALARKGHCRRAPGVVIARDPKKPKLWWEDVASDKKPVGIRILNWVRDFIWRFYPALLT